MREAGAAAARQQAKPARTDLMVHFVCARCRRPLVWAAATATVQCPSCGRWIRANRFWQEQNDRRPKRATGQPEQLELF
jgi:LSD1 subclass zinc finger protein